MADDKGTQPPPYQQPPPPTGQPPPAMGQPQPMGVAPAMVVVQGVLPSPQPMQMPCPNCHQQIVTATEFVDGTAVWLAAGVLCLVGCWLGCCLIPFCVNEAKDVKHTCPNCNHFIGMYKRI